ncbi:23S rRNA (pseudouridine(1915)-N(3))-methyltransferase RlmH [uncultured Desulfovibrio sp.]|uniref:23S rRNA (pseudouridine(1915)-N(3))-methyltransferase RlmH n=1 Tax=uncultured Desulfovibrio sp. TaxID=167968 RepID=UPI00261BE39D|nr:23S rRNA (pseudouridine(1915)-N(3))-methyltransferase RlmH [uncultured Desulfovibrio sp.]
MAGKPLRIVCVGKIKTPFWREAVEHYAQRIRRWRPLDMTEVRDGDASLPTARRNEQEARRLQEALTPQDAAIVLDERGASLTSPQLAALLQKLDQEAAGRPCFIIGGPFGLTDEVRAAARRVISLGPMTLPHELARVLLLEQIYRAECIVRRIPYHHE